MINATRSEASQEIIDAYFNGQTNGFNVAIEKAVKWLLNVDYDSLRYRDYGEEFNEELFVDDFRKAMKE